MTEPTGKFGFAPPRANKALSTRRTTALELAATVALTVSLVIAATAVSVGKRSLVSGEGAEPPAAQMPAAAGRAARQ